MKIYGLQKLTLLDFPGHLAATVFTGGCNFRCPFCHNASLVFGKEPVLMGEEEFFSFLESRKGKLEGVCITGGEPTLSPDLTEFIKKISAHGFKIKLDTNGYNPEKLEEILSLGLLDYVAMDIKNSPEKYAMTAGLNNMDINKIKRSVNLLREGGCEYEFRTTLVNELHTLDDIKKIGQWLEGSEKWFLQTFTDSGNLIGENFTPVSREISLKMLEEAEKYVKTARLRGQ